MKNNNNEHLNGIKQYNFNFIKNYPEKLETEIKDIESKAMNLLMIDGVFITLIITIVFSSTPILIDKIPRLALQILIFLVICYTLHFITVAIFSIKCFRVKKYDYFDSVILKNKNQLPEHIQDLSESTMEKSEFKIALDIIEKNKISLVKKQGFVDIALNSFFIGVIILSVILIFCTAFIFTF